MAQKKKEANKQLFDQYKELCPPTHLKNLEALIRKTTKHDKITEQIQQWWDAPELHKPIEEEWVDFSKKSKPVVKRGGDRDNRGGFNKENRDRVDRDNRGEIRRDNRDRGAGGGRGGGGRYGDREGSGAGRGGGGDRGGRGYGRGRGMVGGRGGGADRRARGAGRGGGRGEGSGSSAGSSGSKPASTSASAGAAASASASSGPAAPEAPKAVAPKKEEGAPTTVTTARPLQGAWGQRAAAAAAPEPATPVVGEDMSASNDEPVAAAVTATPVEETPELEIVEDIADAETDETEASPTAPLVSSDDPTPSGMAISEEDTPATDASITEDPPAQPAPAPAPSGGNVWATKGSAHLIQAEKKPVSTPSSATAAVEEHAFDGMDEPLLTADDLMLPETSVPVPTASDALELDSGLPASVNGANINAAGWDPVVPVSVNVIPSPVGPVSVAAQSVVDVPLLDSVNVEEIPVEAPVVVAAPVPVPAPVPVDVKPANVTAPASTSILNMGHWETGEGEESASHDFGFGSFGNDNDIASVEEPVVSVSVPVQVPVSKEAVAANTVSPARPPPGLGIGMPPMPDNIPHVHELENNLEQTTLNDAKEDHSSHAQPHHGHGHNQPVVSALPDNLTSQTAAPVGVAVPQEANTFGQMPQHSVVPQQQQQQQSYASQYGMGMYNYNAAAQSGVGVGVGTVAPNGFMGVGGPGAAPVLPNGVGVGGVPPQTQPKQGGGVGLQPQQQQPQQNQASIYGGVAGAASASGAQGNDGSNAGGDGSANAATNAGAGGANPSNPAAGMPPGMHGMPQYNPALFYGQQPYQMGQPSPYGYGFAGQYGGVQAGYGFQQVMGQGAGYGHQQPYEEQVQHQTQQHQQHHGGNSHQGGYNKNSGGGGGYRGRNNHHNQHNNQHQYQNQYNPQNHGGYGGHAGQPYNMGYNDHFNQRGGGYGPAATMDPYMNAGYDQGDQLHKGGNKKGGNNNNQHRNNNFGGGNNQNGGGGGGMHQNQYQQGGGGGGHHGGGHQGGNQFGSGLPGGADSDRNNSTSNNGGLSYQGWGNGGL